MSARPAVAAPKQVMAKAYLQQRLLAIMSRPGRAPSLQSGMFIPDVAAFLHLRVPTLRDCANKRREIDDTLQVQLSNFFTLWDKGLLVKVKTGRTFEIVRVPAKTGAIEPPRATIDLGGLTPRIIWSR